MRKKFFQPEIFRYVFDSSSLINIERSGRRNMKRLRDRIGAVLIPEKVAQEIYQPNTPLQRLLDSYPQVSSPLQDTAEEEQYLRIRSQDGIDDAEAAAMAIALNRQMPLVIDERETKATGKARNHGIKVLSSGDFVKSEM